MEINNYKIELPDFPTAGIYVSSFGVFVDPTNKQSVNACVFNEIENIVAGKSQTIFYKFQDIDTIKLLVERINFPGRRRRIRIPGRLGDPEYIFDLGREEFVEKKSGVYYQKKRQGSSYDDADIIRIINAGNGDAHGYGD